MALLLVWPGRENWGQTPIFRASGDSSSPFSLRGVGKPRRTGTRPMPGESTARLYAGGGLRRVAMRASHVTLLLLLSTDTFAATYRYSSSSNRIYVENGGTGTLSAIHSALPSAPLDLVSSGVWLLRANLIVTGGTELDLHGSSVGGDVNELRLKSDGS